MAKIFIDGEHGTTGLQIRKRLEQRQDLELISIPEAERRNLDLRTDYLRAADIVILCLPDDASREAVSLLERNSTRVIDSSTAFRVDPHWVYGFAEMTKGQAERIKSARFVANPGCYPTGAIALMRPLRENGLLPEDYPISVNAVSGYTGGGKQMIGQMEDPSREDVISANHFLYGLTLKHKHIPEMTTHGLLASGPVFTPNVGRFAQGMIVNIPLHLRLLKGKIDMKAIHDVLASHYEGQNIVEMVPLDQSAHIARIDAEEMADTDRMKLYVTGNENGSVVNLVATLDNLGKGASGAAVQNLDLMLGITSQT